MYTSEPFYFKYIPMYLFEFDSIKSSRFCFVDLGLLLLFLWAWGSLIFVIINFWSPQLFSLNFCNFGQFGGFNFLSMWIVGAFGFNLVNVGGFLFCSFEVSKFSIFLWFWGFSKKIGWNFAYGRWMGSLGFFLWTLGGSCFVLFFDKNLRVYKNVLSFWGFSKNILWSFTTKGKKGYSLLQNVGALH